MLLVVMIIFTNYYDLKQINDCYCFVSVFKYLGRWAPTFFTFIALPQMHQSCFTSLPESAAQWLHRYRGLLICTSSCSWEHMKMSSPPIPGLKNRHSSAAGLLTAPYRDDHMQRRVLWNQIRMSQFIRLLLWRESINVTLPWSPTLSDEI